MKKLFLLGALICAGQLYGMEPEKPDMDPTLWGRSKEEGLPDEIKTLIIMALKESGNNPEEAIKNIIKVSRLNKQFYGILHDEYGDLENLQYFTKLVHIIANKFGLTTQEVASKMKDLGMAIAQNYIILNISFAVNIRMGGNIVRIAKLIRKHGADVNYTWLDTSLEKGGEEVFTPLRYAVRNRNIDAVKLLLDSGANPNYILNGKKAIDYATDPEIKNLLRNAMEKWQK